jgi:Replication-relaxation
MYPKIQPRDIGVLTLLYKCRYLTGSQIQRACFPSHQTRWRRTNLLLELGMIKSFTAPNIPEHIFYLDKKGAEAVAWGLSKDIEELDWQSPSRTPKDYYFLRHFLAINDFYITLNLACRKSKIDLIEFIPEYLGEKNTKGYVQKRIRDRINGLSHTPDAVFALQKDGKPALFFLEIDRGGEVISDPQKGLLKAIVFYMNYWASDKWTRYNDDFKRDFKTFRTLIVTTSKERIKHIREAVNNYPFKDPDVRRFLWITLESQITPDWIFESIWQSLDLADNAKIQVLYRIG